jgi:hypothetical protein
VDTPEGGEGGTRGEGGATEGVSRPCVEPTQRTDPQRMRPGKRNEMGVERWTFMPAYTVGARTYAGY